MKLKNPLPTTPMPCYLEASRLSEALPACWWKMTTPKVQPW